MWVRALCLLGGIALWGVATFVGTGGAVYLAQAASKRHRKPGVDALHPEFWYQLTPEGERLRDRGLLYVLLALGIGCAGFFLARAGGAR